MRIGELAKATGVTTRALRFYEEQGLLTAARSHNGYRHYDESAIERVANIRYLLDSGLTMEDIRPLGSCLQGDLPARQLSSSAVELVNRRLAVLDERIETLTRVRKQLSSRAAAARGGVGA
ncbi:DNA-binding transcriptional MerR regulator [Amycolatopsis echigonensis]|uniref:DNA-binding transcriptional MerR regulator n=1 Tax=Amycolatopsis echigonensis TaxID=2576905 RepID=A0A2N3WLZ9_9PSEU|nr:MerR family transcriptional regulator [Amycolatopsis niigatensis]PKV94904.1 DNA-binding transcriptional MerR regulator [Amycolatopsis niigatensis]